MTRSANTLDAQIERAYRNAVERGAIRSVALLLWSDWLAGNETFHRTMESLKAMEATR